MVRGRSALIALTLVAVAAALAACVPAPAVVDDSSVTVAVNQPLTSLNPSTTYGATAVNEQLAYATSSNFVYVDNRARTIEDTSFGTVEQVSSDPLRVKYTVKAGVRWSDGSPVDAADLLLSWAAGSGAFNQVGFTPSRYASSTGMFRADFPKNVVWFDAPSTSGLRDVTKTPVIGDDGRSITLDYDRYFVDWKLAFGVGLPAHVVAAKALGTTSATAGKDAVLAAIRNGDRVALASISRAWNSGFNLSKGSLDPDLAVSDGPYRVASVTSSAVSLVANTKYRGDHVPRFEKLDLRVLPTRAKAIKALAAGTVDVITPAATAAAATALLGVGGATIASGFDATFDHLDLQQANGKSGAFDDPLVRQAFLKVVPRQKIVDRVAGALQEEATPRSSFVFFPGTAAYQAASADNGSAAFDEVDVAAAKRLLKRAGVSKPTVCILFDPTNPTRTAEFTLIRASAAEAGFRVTNCSSTDWLARLGTKGAYDASLFGWRSTNSAVTAAASRLHSGRAAQNYNFYASPVTDKLLDTLAQTGDDDAQNQLLQQIDRKLFADGYGVPLFQAPSLTAFSTSVKGIARSPFSPGVFWNIWEWRPAR